MFLDFFEENQEIFLDISSPEHLSAPVSPLDQTDQTLQKLATKSYLGARQIADLRRDIAARLLPTEGPFNAGDLHCCPG